MSDPTGQKEGLDVVRTLSENEGKWTVGSSENDETLQKSGIPPFTALPHRSRSSKPKLSFTLHSSLPLSFSLRDFWPSPSIAISKPKLKIQFFFFFLICSPPKNPNRYEESIEDPVLLLLLLREAENSCEFPAISDPGEWSTRRSDHRQGEPSGGRLAQQREKDGPKTIAEEGVNRLLGKIAMLGLDAAGKTTMLYKLQNREDLSTIVTVGLNHEKFQYKNVMFMGWDVGHQGHLEPLYKHYFHDTNGLIYVVDSLDRERIDTSKIEFQAIINQPFMTNCVILVFANKQDMKGAMTPMEVCEGLGLNELENRKWQIEGTCALMYKFYFLVI
ncbi:hypothetical protein LXL04_028144 [Taraxacum kok-saghyz]